MKFKKFSHLVFLLIIFVITVKLTLPHNSISTAQAAYPTQIFLTERGLLQASTNIQDVNETSIFIDSGQNLGSTNSTSVALGDLDGDGDLDAFVGNGGEDEVWMNDGAGVFTRNDYLLPNGGTITVRLGDIDDDGDLDALVSQAGITDNPWIRINNGAGVFNTSTWFSASWSRGTVLGDIDNDNDLDAIVGVGSDVIWLNDGGQLINSGRTLDTMSSNTDLGLGDIDGDGDLDLFLGQRDMGGSNGGANSVLINDGTGFFTNSNQSLGNFDSYTVALGDLDGDGDLDAFIGNKDQANKVWLNNSAGIFTDTIQNLGNSDTRSVVLGDLDGDGDLDAIAGNMGGQPNIIWLNDGAGNFSNTESLGNSDSAGVALGDLDGDGDLDAFVANANNQANKVWLNQSPLLNFAIDKDGYDFANYGGIYPISPSLLNPDYSKSDLVRMFGEEAACWKVIDSLCILKHAAVKWQQAANVTMNGGHCDGMAVTSLRFFKGLDNPLDFQSNASQTHDLALENARSHIAYYFIEQMTDPVRNYKSQTVQNPPTTTVDVLQQALANGASDPTTLIVRQIGQGGHTITPYTVEYQGSGIYWIRVYDNNHPNDNTRYVIVDTNNDTWSYDLGSTTWSGNANTHTLGIVPISLYAQQPVCPWCQNATQANSSGGSGVQVGEIYFNGQGHLLITNSSGQRVGYIGDQFINEVPESDAYQIDTGLGVQTEPIYTIPLSDTYHILLDGQTLTQTETVSMTQFGPGYAVSIDGISLDPTAQSSLTIGADGKQASFHSDQSDEIQLEFAWDTIDFGYLLSVQEIDISTGNAVTLTINSVDQQLAYRHTQEGSGEYNLMVSRLSDDGEQLFDGVDIPISANDTHYIQYGSWNGTGSVTIEVDHGSNGTIDEIIQVENLLNSIYLPIVLR